MDAFTFLFEHSKRGEVFLTELEDAFELYFLSFEVLLNKAFFRTRDL